MDNRWLYSFLERALEEDIGSGDHSSLASIPMDAEGQARLIIKEEGMVAGIDVAVDIFKYLEPDIRMETYLSDGSMVHPGDIAFIVTGKIHTLLKAERLVLNIMQRMSGIATETARYTNCLKGTGTKLLDTRKTAPGLRLLDKMAVKIGGGENHRMGLYDMIMLKDNHIDHAGGIRKAIQKTRDYLQSNHLDLKVVVEARNLSEVRAILETGGVNRILLDNFSPEMTGEAVQMIAGKFETESSGGITMENIREYALAGVDFVSVGALTHHVKALDMSLKAVNS